MIVDKCCGFVNLRPGIVVLAIAELSISIGQFLYSHCEPSVENLVLVCVASALGIVASISLLFGAIKSSRKWLLTHMIGRTIEMVMSIICGILIFVALSNNQSNKQCNEETDILLGICFLGECKTNTYNHVGVKESLKNFQFDFVLWQKSFKYLVDKKSLNANVKCSFTGRFAGGFYFQVCVHTFYRRMGYRYLHYSVEEPDYMRIN